MVAGAVALRPESCPPSYISCFPVDCWLESVALILHTGLCFLLCSDAKGLDCSKDCEKQFMEKTGKKYIYHEVRGLGRLSLWNQRI